MPDELRCWADISLDRIAANYRAVRAVVGPDVEVLCVVKANAYGHGMIEVTRRLLDEGTRWLGVTSVEEGVALRQAGFEAPVLVMADTLGGGFAEMLEHRLTPAVHDLADLAYFDKLAAERGERLAVHVKVDTGMGRLGAHVTATEIIAALRACPHLEFQGLMSHFASASDFAGSQSEDQLREFDDLILGLAPRIRHISATSAVAYGRRSAWKDMVRIGLGLYGYVSPPSGPAPPCILDVAPALTWKARILTVKDLPSGAAVGYDARFTTTRPTRIAVISAGYADGVMRQLSNCGAVLVEGRPAPILGSVSMDVTTVDVTECPAARPGGEVTLLGEGLDAAYLGALAGTISYDVLCKIQSRVLRRY